MIEKLFLFLTLVTFTSWINAIVFEIDWIAYAALKDSRLEGGASLKGKVVLYKGDKLIKYKDGFVFSIAYTEDGFIEGKVIPVCNPAQRSLLDRLKEYLWGGNSQEEPLRVSLLSGSFAQRNNRGFERLEIINVERD